MTYVSNYAIAAILCLQTVCHCVISTLGQYIHASILRIYPHPSNATHTVATTITASFYPSKTACPANGDHARPKLSRRFGHKMTELTNPIFFIGFRIFSIDRSQSFSTMTK